MAKRSQEPKDRRGATVTGKGQHDDVNMIQSKMERVQFQIPREGRKEREWAKVLVLSGVNKILASLKLSKNNVKPDDSKRK